MIRVYTASTLAHAGMWRGLAGRWPEMLFTASWIRGDALARDGDPAACKLGWTQNLEDVARSHAVLVYGAPGDALRGALVEAGMGLALGKAVIVVGRNDGYGTWRHHPRVRAAATFDDARAALNETFG